MTFSPNKEQLALMKKSKRYNSLVAEYKKLCLKWQLMKVDMDNRNQVNAKNALAARINEMNKRLDKAER